LELLGHLKGLCTLSLILAFALTNLTRVNILRRAEYLPAYFRLPDSIHSGGTEYLDRRFRKML
jgi:hypothetical protein